MRTRERERVEYPEPHERDAARRYLEHDYAATHLSGAARREGNRHASAIDEEHPRAREIAMTGTRRELGELPKHLAGHQQQLRRHAGIDRAETERIRREYRSGPYREPEEEPEGPDRRERAEDAARRGLELAGTGAGSAASYAADTSWGELIADLMLAGIGMSLAYLFLTRPQGPSKVVLGASNVVRGIVSPTTDPLNPKGFP